MAQNMAREEKWYNNVAPIIMGRSQSTAEKQEGEENNEETEVVKALKDKYDALKDKLLMEVKMMLKLKRISGSVSNCNENVQVIAVT